MAKKSATPVKKSPSKAAVSSTPSKKKAAPKKRVASKPKGKTIKGEINEEPDMEKEEDGLEVEEEAKPVKKVTTTKKAAAKKNGKAAPVETETKHEDSELISSETITKAVEALSSYIENKPEDKTEKASLFEDDSFAYYLQVTTTKFLASKPLSKPKSIQIPHKVVDTDELKICLFVKDNVIDSDLLEQIEEAKIPNLAKIITAKELKGEFKPFEAKRKLISEYDIFLSDDYLIPTLPKLLGKVFYDNSTKFPIPIKVYAQNKFSIKTLTNSVAKVITSVTYIPPVGVNLSLKVGSSEFKTAQLVGNIQAILKGIKLQDNNKIRTVQLKTLDSPSLPLYYAEKLYSEEDISKDDVKAQEAGQPVKIDASIEVPSGVKLTEFEKGLLELAADPEDVEKILSKKVKQAKKRKITDSLTEEKKSKKGKK